jgi:hypothetical protein
MVTSVDLAAYRSALCFGADSEKMVTTSMMDFASSILGNHLHEEEALRKKRCNVDKTLAI